MDSEELLPDNGEMKNYYKCRLTYLAPRGKGGVLEKIVTKLTNWFDPYQQIVNIEENGLPGHDAKIQKKKKPIVSGCLVTPAISLMLYVRETGDMGIRDAERILKKTPWKFHHKVELQNKSCPNTSLAKQEFYSLSADLPLFAACPVLTENEHLRISLYVHDFSSMVEFYRLITDTEIESHKPEFCIFQIFQQPGLDVQLSLKRSKYISPVPLDSAYISFNVRNIEVIKTGLQTDVKHVDGNVYTVRDPDGNLVVMYETTCCVDDTYTGFAQNTDIIDNVNVDDLKSLKSTAESHDSGRGSDVDCALGEDTPMPKVYQKGVKSNEKGNVSDGYASSVSFTSDVITAEKGKNKGKGQKSGMPVIKRSNTFTTDVAKSLDRKGVKSGTRGKAFAPVYI